MMLARKTNAKHGRGFTLIELSIVLVIIGLIVGGILVGRELIRQSELRGDLRELDKMTAAINSFKLKYGCVPGDCTNADQFFSTPSPENGDGNGIIDSLADSGTPGSQYVSGYYTGLEFAYATDLLARAGLITLQPFDANDVGVDINSTVPKLKTGNAGFIVRGECMKDPDTLLCMNTGRHTYRLGVWGTVQDILPGRLSTTPVVYTTEGTQRGIYTPQDAFSLDTKIDDGNAVTGSVYAGWNMTGDDSAFFPIPTHVYVDGVCNAGAAPSYGLKAADCQYDTTKSDKLVGLFVRAGF